ncbi:MAG: DUF2141 domain-containing protein [Proteobacteria bacterium]|nr:DUF2141 domain-containing protein [Pseudomonadota bacterium]
MLQKCLPPLLFLMTVASAQAAVLQVSIAGIRSDQGTLYICVFTAPGAFPACSDQPAARSRRLKPVAGTIRTTFDDVPAGPCAISVMHDENDNGKLDTNLIGIPREGVGVSMNPPPRRGPPRFEDAAFTLTPQGGTVTVNMVYP